MQQRSAELQAVNDKLAQFNSKMAANYVAGEPDKMKELFADEIIRFSFGHKPNFGAEGNYLWSTFSLCSLPRVLLEQLLLEQIRIFFGYPAKCYARLSRVFLLMDHPSCTTTRSANPTVRAKNMPEYPSTLLRVRTV